MRRKFEIKNTTGYRLLAFLDADTPLEIFRRLLVGSEGTLAFIAEAVFDTVPRPRHDHDLLAALPEHRRRGRAGARAGGRGRHGSRADGGARADRRRALASRHPRALEGAAPRLGGAAGRVRRRRRRRARSRSRRGPRRSLAERRAPAPGRLHPRRAGDGAGLDACARGCSGWSGKLRPPGTALITEDVCVPPARIAEAAARHPGAARQARLPVGRGRPRLGREPPLHAHARRSSDAADRERYDAFMHELVELIVDKYDGSLKAEHGTGVQHGAVRGAGVGRPGDGDDVADQAAGRSRTACSTRRGPEPRPRGAPARPQVDAADRGGGDHVRGVRLLRARLPQPQRDHDAAPADRAAAGDGAPAGGVAGARGAARASTSTTRSRPARRRHLPARLPGGASTPAS